MAARAGIGFTPLDNGFAAVDDPAAVQAICDCFDKNGDLGPGRQVDRTPAVPVYPADTRPGTGMRSRCCRRSSP